MPLSFRFPIRGVFSFLCCSTKVKKPWYYTTVIDPNLNPALSPWAKISLLNPTSSDYITLDILKGGVSLIGPVQSPVKFFPVVTIDTKYSWYVSRSSSASSSSIDCRKPGYNYPGTRFSKVPYCSSWCADNNGQWIDNGYVVFSFFGPVVWCCLLLAHH